jgi:hypothetical protein
VINSTSPPDELLQSLPGLSEISTVLRIYESYVFPSFPCPPSLLEVLIRVNKLRERQHFHNAARADVAWRTGRSGHDPQYTSTEVQDTMKEANVLLGEALGFDGEQWAIESDAGRGRQDDWSRFARLYQAAMLVFTLLALDMCDRESEQMALVHESANVLRKECQDAVESSNPLRMFLCWPTIVLGVAAAQLDDHREVVSRFLVRMGSEHGVVSPVLAHEVLQRFWSSGKTRWNDCFDQPYVFFI